MKHSRPLTWLLVSVACFIAAFYFWELGKKHQAERTRRPGASTTGTPAQASQPPRVPTQLTSSVVERQSSAPVIPPLHGMTNSTVRNSTNFPYRLSNTTKSLGELMRSDKAILLENALIDSSKPVDLAIPDSLRTHGDPGAYIIQANGTITPAFRAQVLAAGLTIVSYIPNNAFLVEGTQEQVASFNAYPWQPYYKIQPSLMPSALAGFGAPAVNVAVLPNAVAATTNAFNKMRITVASQSRSPFGTEMNLENVSDLAALANLDGIELIEPSSPRMVDNDLSRVYTAVSSDVFVPSNYLNLTGSNVLVDVNDSWVPTNDPADGFNPAVTINPDLTNIIGPASVYPPGFGIADFVGHATHVGGIIACNGSNSPVNAMGSQPGANFRGKAPQATLFALPVQSTLTDAQLQQAAGDTNALISNNSWGYGSSSYDLAAASYDQAVRDSDPGKTGSQSLIYVFAAGNNGAGDDSGLNGQPDSLSSPAVGKNVISVGASELPRNVTNQVYVCDACLTGDTNPADACTTNQPWLGETDSSNQVAGFSARGNVGIDVEGQYGRFKPDVVAPGTFVVSTRSQTWDTNAYYSPIADNHLELDGFVVYPTNSPFNFPGIYVPCDATQMVITVVSTAPTNVPLQIYVGSDGTASNLLGTGTVSLPPDEPLSPTDTQWFISVGNPTNVPVTFNLIVDLITTNSLGDYFDVLRTNLNDQLTNATGGVFYRYETGTSMAAPAVSGVLALMEDYFTNRLQYIPSPAAMKALLINGARSLSPSYDFQVQNTINYQGWGMVNLTNSLPLGITTNFNQAAPTIVVDQNPNTALATGDSQTYFLTVNSNAYQGALRVTLDWTDPPGNPAASLKLVNNLELVVTNFDDPTNPVVFFGNNFNSGDIFTAQWDGDTNNIPFDTVNNVQNVYIPFPLGTNYSITVFAKDVNVNAVTANSNGIVQDFALVAAWDNGELTNAITLTDNPVIPSYMPDVTQVTNEFAGSPSTSGALLMNQLVGANPPQSTNELALSLDQHNWDTNGQITLGSPNQWHFYVITNTVGTNASVSVFTNAAFATFLPPNLSIPPVGVNAPDQADATRPEADIDLYVARGPNAYNLTNLDTNVLATADKSLGRGGTELVIYTNAQQNEVFYVGVQSQDQEAAEYAFAGLFSQYPFSSLGSNGQEVIRAVNVPTPILTGTPAHPGLAITIGIGVQPIKIQRAVVTNQMQDVNFGDLVGTLTHNQINSVLNNHTFGNGSTNQTFIYEDNGQGDVPGSQHTDGPGSLTGFIGQEGFGLWTLIQADTSEFNTGEVDSVSIRLDPQSDGNNGVNATIQPGTFFFDFIDVPAEATNLTICVTQDPQAPSQFNQPVQLFVRYGEIPTLTQYDYMKFINPPGDCLSIDRTALPPLRPGRYYVGVYNPNGTAQTIHLSWTLALDVNGVNPGIIVSTNVPGPLLEDAVTNNSIFITNQQNIVSVNVGVVMTDPRISDLDLTLVSPTGQRILLMENRGGLTATNLGHLNITTNIFGQVTAGGANANTNILGPVPNQGVLVVNYDMYTVPDQMDVYYNGVDIFHSGYVSGAGTFNIPYGPGPANTISIVMNQGNNPVDTTQWIYTPYVVSEDYTYLTFTDDTNLTEIPIKYAIPPYDNLDNGTNILLSDFDLATNGNYIATPNSSSNLIADASGGWSVTTNNVFVLPTNYYTGTNLISMATNMVSVFSDPFIGFNGANVLALANGSISRVLTLTPERNYTINYFYRGPGVGGWWRGEGNASDSADPETLGNNGYLIGSFTFPAGEVGQAFAMENSGAAFEFGGTNSYVQVRQSPSVDVGSNSSGFTVEGWINPTNTTFQQPIAEWLAGVPIRSNAIAITNLYGQVFSNFNIVAGPFLNPANNHYYYLLGQTNWTTSELWAQALGGHLAEVDDANEENWIYDNFARWGLTNHTMWIGLTNGSINGTSNFVWSTGSSNLVYTNWALGQPTNCGGGGYVAIFGPTNAFPGLWTVLNNNGVSCTGVTNAPFGVVEVNRLQTNGVQLWISVTNSVTNNVLTGLGRLYANIMDTNNVPHEIFSAPGLVKSNVFQHVALTYNTNTGVAKLYYNGTNVVTTNLGVFVPNTTGDFLLGRDMNTESNNFFWGVMDEMTIYSRYLSDAEIAAIYNVSASTTNRNIGKFNPAVTPAFSLAEAQVVFGGVTNLLFGVNNSWQAGGFTFKPSSNTLPVQITGLEPGILLDAFSISEQPPGNLYYLPEQALNALVGSNAYGNWSLEIRDSRTGLIDTNAQLISWELQFILETNTPTPIQLNPQMPATNTIPPGEVGYFVVNVPDWANDATNILVSSTSPVSLLFNQTAPPESGVGNDFTFVNNNTTGSTTLSATPPSIPPLLPGQSYYLAVTNSSGAAATVVLEVDFNITTLTNGIPYTAAFNTNDIERPFIFNVSSNATEATFQLMQLTGNADLVLRQGLPIPSLMSADYGSYSGSNADETIYVLTNSAPVPLSAGPWYLDVIKRVGVSDTNITGAKMRYAVLAKELTNTPTIINLTNRVPFTWTAGPGAALTNFFKFGTNNFTSVVPTNLGIHFELYNQSGNGDLTVQTDAPPLAPPFFQSSRSAGNGAEFIDIQTNPVSLTNLQLHAWYLGVPNNETNPITYTILGVIDTNAVVAFPTAEGAGSITRGGTFGTNVYYVVNLNDSGPGSLRNGLSQTNGAETIVFDVGGTINLLTPLYITNSFLTIAGQTAPGGITITGASTYVENANDIILRYLRFRPGPSSVWFSGFETGIPETHYAPDYINGWYLSSGSADLYSATQSPFPAPIPEGTHFVDINGVGPGVLSTNIPTAAGTTYQISFSYTKNADSGGTTQAAIVVNGHEIGRAVSSVANSWGNLNWSRTSFVFTATSPSTSLALMSTNTPGPSGVLLDAFSVTTGTNTTDALQFTNVQNVIVDHVSTEFAPNDDVSILNSSNVTVQWSVLAGSQNKTNYLSGGSEVLYGAGDVTLHHNLYANNYSASPHIGDDITLDFVNNVIFNWGVFAGLSTNDSSRNPGGFTNYLNYAANYAIAWTNSVFTNVAFYGGTTNTWIFQTDNVIDTNLNFVLDGANTGWGMFSNQFTEFSAPFIINPTAPDEAFVAYERVLDFAGTALGLRDNLDRGIVQQVRFESVNTNTTAAMLTNMVAWWKGESNTLDSVGGNNGTFVGTASYAPGEVNTAFNMTGNNSVSIPDSPTMDQFTNSITIECWMKNATIGNNTDWKAIVSKANVCWRLFCTTFSDTADFSIDPTPGSPNIDLTGTRNVNDGKWHHIAATYDGTIMCLYVDGTLDASRAATGLINQTSDAILIGDLEGTGKPAGHDYHFTGELDEVTLYHRALSACEIAAIYNAGTNGKTALLAPTNLVFSPNPPFKDTDQDGIPDFWEITLGENPTNFSATADRDGDGDTDLEEYLNWLGAPHALTLTNNPVAVDLYALAGNTGNLTFGVANGTNGTVYLTNGTSCSALGNTIAIFTPTNNFGGGSNGGFGSFTFTVTNMDTIAYFGPVTVSVFASSVPVTNATVAPFIFTNPPDITMLVGTTDTVLNAAAPTNGITYMLLNPPSWATINTNTGLITLTPGLCAATNVTIFTVATDTNVPPDRLTNQFNVTVLNSNMAPVFLTNPPNVTNVDLGTIVVTNTAIDTNCPPNPLGYQVCIAPYPPGTACVGNASIDNNGVITWTPDLTQQGLFLVTTIVTNYDQYAANATILSATNQFYIFVAAPLDPFAFTQPAQAVTGATAQLNGMATANGLATLAWFEWGTNTSYGNQTPPVSIGSGFGVVYTSNQLSGLTINVPYHYRLVVSNSLAVAHGFDQIFDEAYVAGWGADYLGQIEIPSGLSNVVTIGGAYDHSLAIRNNETVLSWGDNTFNQTNVPAGLNNVLAVAGGQYFSSALTNGSVISWGADPGGRYTNVPPGLGNVIMIAGGTYASFALQSAGTIVSWGGNFFNITNPPVGLSNVVEVAGGSYHAVAIRNDGTLIAWGDNSSGQTNIPASATNIVQIACGDFHSVALRADGTVVSWGDNSSGQTNVPAGLSNVVAVAAGGFHSLALKSDGSIVGWGDNSSGQITVPLGLTNVVAISAGYLHNLALTPVPFFSSTNLVIVPTTNGVPETNSVFPGKTVFYQVNVPANVDFDTNSLFAVSGGNLNVWFTTNTPPSVTNANDTLLLANTNQGSVTLSTTSTPPIIDGKTYYLGVQNTNNFSVTYGIEVDFHFLLLATNTAPVSIVHTNLSGNNGFLLIWFAPSNDLFNVQWTPSLWPTNWSTFTNPPVTTFDTTYGSINATNTRFEFFDDGSQTGGFGPWRFYRVILLNPSAGPSVIALTNGVPLNFTTSAGATNYFSFDVTQTNAAVLFELYNLTGNGILNLQLSNLPVTPPYYSNSAGPGTNYQQIVLRTNGALPNINAVSWFLGVPNQTAGSISYTIRAVLPTNGILISGLPFDTLASRSGGTNLNLTWSPTVSGEIYEVRTNANLGSTNWGALTDITATATSVNFTNPIPVGTMPDLFFDIVQIP